MKSKALFPGILIIVIILIFCVTCEDLIENPPMQMEFDNAGFEVVTNSSGIVKIHSYISNEDGNYDVNYEISLVDKKGKPISGMTVSYNELNGKSFIYGRDNNGKYQSFLIYGTPKELGRIGTVKSSYIGFNPKSNNGNLKSGQSIILLTAAILVTVYGVTKTELNIIKNTYKIQKFYVTDYVREGDDYIMYCKNFTQIAELIKSRTNILLNTSSILINFITGGASTSTIEILGDVASMKTEDIRDQLLGERIDSWGITADKLVGRKVAVRVYPVNKENWASNVRNIFAYTEVDLSSTECNIENVPDGVNSILDNRDVKILESKGMKIYTGLNPPNISGNYYCDYLRNLETGNSYKNYSYQFYNQTNDLKISMKIASSNSDATGYGAFISGNSGSFSLYCEINDVIDDNGTIVKIKSTDIISGILMTSGIKNFQEGMIIISKENDINSHFMDVGETRIIYESDYIASKVNSFPYTTGTKSIQIEKNIIMK